MASTTTTAIYGKVGRAAGHAGGSACGASAAAWLEQACSMAARPTTHRYSRIGGAQVDANHTAEWVCALLLACRRCCRRPPAHWWRPLLGGAGRLMAAGMA